MASDAGVAQANDAGLALANDAWLALALVAVDPAAAGGMVVRAQAGPVRDRFVADLRRALGPGRAWRVVPTHADDDRLLGGIDLAATLRTGRRVAERGLLAEADGGVVVLTMAERASRSTVAHVTAAMDSGVAVCARHGVEASAPARFGVVAFDESDARDAGGSGGAGDDRDLGIDASLADRLAFVVDLRALSVRDADAASALWRDASASASAERRAAGRVATVDVGDDLVEALCAAAAALGVDAPRASQHAVRVARLAAALHGRAAADTDDAALAARLVLAPRATRHPADAAPPDEPNDAADDALEPPPPDEPDTDGDDASREPPDAETERPPTASELDDIVLAAAAAAIPPGLLARLVAERAVRSGRGGGRAGEVHRQQRRGRPLGSVRGDLRRGGRLDLVATLRAAAPWQRARQRDAAALGRPVAVSPGAPVRASVRVMVRAEDIRIGRFAERTRTTTIFAVDASGSAALHRLGEAKGAVELLLADCYVRRDSVAVIGFRGDLAELLLPPTRSLARAKRALAELPGGGGTPLATALDAARELAQAVRRRGDTPLVVVLSDGRANVARDGTPGRPRAEADALVAARAWRDTSATVLFVDTSPQPTDKARALAAALGARYLPLPHADARQVSSVVQAAAGASRVARPATAAR